MKPITLTQGKVALVDDEDYQELSTYKWTAHKGKNGRWYAKRVVQSNGKQCCILMHQQILGFVPEIDHVDHDGLNNQRHNIRQATRSQNTAHKRKLVSKTSKFKGVHKHGQCNRWSAQICVSGKTKHLGLFPTEELAASAYNSAASLAWGGFATLNNIH